MPRGRKAKTTTRGPSSQSTLSFNSKSARVTKPHTRQDDFVNKKLSDPAQAQIEEEVSSPIVEDVTVTPQQDEDEEHAEAKDLTRSEDQNEVEDAEEDLETAASVKTRSRKQRVSEKKDERELAAKKVTDAQLKKYWKAEEDGRLAPRVHQSSLSLHEKILRHFDLSSQYGPCIGIQRLQRWKRANTLGLDPPVEVLAVLLREEDKTTSQGCGKLAYIDELAGGRVVLVE